MKLIRTFTLLAGLLAAAAATTTAHAQAWPNKPIRIVVPFAAGGPADVLARVLGAKIAADLGQQVLIENKGGAGGTLGAADVVRSPADGYNFLFSSTGALVIFPALSPTMPYSPDKDLIAVVHAVTTPQVIVTGSRSRFGTLADLVKYAKANPGKLNFASAGGGTTTQLSAELLKREAGIFITHIPYRGAAPALTDVIAGTADFMVADTPAVLQFVRSGQLKPLALTWPTRSPVLQGVPTTAESGLAGVVGSTWYGVMAPAKTPDDIVGRMNAAVNKALKDPETAAFIVAQGSQVVGGSAEEFGRFVRAESAKWGTLAKAIGAKLD
jgi:tripartite-type tricarboxylate transporter receptor subunit TctC